MQNPKCIAYAFTDGVEERDKRKDIEENPMEFLVRKLRGSRFDFGVDNITRTGAYKEMGWAYNLRGLLRKFVYKQYDSWQEIYALNKTNVRELVGGRIIKIIEVK